MNTTMTIVAIAMIHFVNKDSACADDDSETSSVCIGTTYAPSMNQVFAQPAKVAQLTSRPFPSANPAPLMEPSAKRVHWKLRVFLFGHLRNQSSEPSSLLSSSSSS